MELHDIGKWAFLIGILLSIVSAFTINVISSAMMILVLFILGLFVGFLNVTRKNSVPFLISALLLLVLGVGGISALSEVNLFGIYNYLAAMLSSFVSFVGAAGLVVAIKQILDTSEGMPKLRRKKK